MNKRDKIIVVVLFIALGLWYVKTMKSNAKRQPPPPDKPPVEQPADPNNPDKNPADPDNTGNPDKNPTDPDKNPTDPDKNPTDPDNTGNPDKNPTDPDNTGNTDKPPVAAPVALAKEFADLKPATPVTIKAEGLSEIVIDPEKGGIVQVILQKHKLDLKSDALMSLGHPDYPVLALKTLKKDEVLKFSHAKIVEQSDTKLTIARQIAGTNVVAQQTWEIVPESYSLKFTVTFKNLNGDSVKLSDYGLTSGFASMLSAPRGLFGSSGRDQAVQFMEANESDSDMELIQKVASRDEDVIEVETMKLQWISVQNKFFVWLLSGEKPIEGGFVEAPPVNPDKNGKKDPKHLIGAVGLGEQVLGGNEELSLNYDFYIGPKGYTNFKALGQNKEQIMQYDQFMMMRFVPMSFIMKYISLAVYWLITSIAGIIGNYGIAIILTTICIRSAFWPITKRSTVWSQKMKQLQPEMQALREKYKNDPQMMNQKTMELYKKHKINPFGGCLPMFFQIPVFFALFNVIRSAVVLRHSGFFLWINDLSTSDALFMIPEALPYIGGMPFNVLPFLMGGAMMLQQALMPTSADPTQQKMMVFMSIMIVFLCYSMPSGLTLYWTVSNIFSIIQYKVIHAKLAKENGQEDDKKKDDKKKKS